MPRPGTRHARRQPAPAAPPPEARSATLETITVTAQKRAENVQKVPISIQVLGTEKLEQLNVKDFDDYVKFLPSVSYQSFGPGFSHVYMRGVASGGDGNHSGSLPSVGMYLDEQPITTIQGALDIHIYDIARVEALSGPQGTLYGASSEAGTIRIITNKPDPGVFAAGYGVEVNAIDGGGIGCVAEGFVNAPLSDNAAIRLVGWDKQDAGYIDNVSRPRTFPTVRHHRRQHRPARGRLQRASTPPARAPRCKIDLDDNWSITPTLMGQHQVANGSFAFDESVGDLQVSHRFPGHVRRPLDPGGAHGAGQDRQLRRHLRLLPPQARRRHRVGLHRLLVLVRHAATATARTSATTSTRSASGARRAVR